MFGISMWEIGLILVVALIFLGPRQLAETARTMGKWYRELNRMSWEIRSSIDLDSLTSSPPPSGNDVSSKPSAPPKTEDLVSPPAEKPGPDFYGELLESSKEEGEKSPTDASSTTETKEPETSLEHEKGKTGQ